MLPKAEDVLSVAQKVDCRVFDRMSDNCYYALINKTICCIIRSRKINLQYGDNVVGIVRKITSKGPKSVFFFLFSYKHLHINLSIFRTTYNSYSCIIETII